MKIPKKNQMILKCWKCHRRYYRVNKKKLLQQVELVVKNNLKQIAVLAVTLGPKKFSIRKENIKKQVTSKEENLKAQQAKEKEIEMLSKIDKKKTNVAMSQRGEEIYHHDYWGTSLQT
jgi:energy-coupling factor transporter ATP-binding protein EcfA2